MRLRINSKKNSLDKQLTASQGNVYKLMMVDTTDRKSLASLMQERIGEKGFVKRYKFFFNKWLPEREPECRVLGASLLEAIENDDDEILFRDLRRLLIKRNDFKRSNDDKILDSVFELLKTFELRKSDEGYKLRSTTNKVSAEVYKALNDHAQQEANRWETEVRLNETAFEKAQLKREWLEDCYREISRKEGNGYLELGKCHQDMLRFSTEFPKSVGDFEAALQRCQGSGNYQDSGLKDAYKAHHKLTMDLEIVSLALELAIEKAERKKDKKEAALLKNQLDKVQEDFANKLDDMKKTIAKEKAEAEVEARHKRDLDELKRSFSMLLEQLRPSIQSSGTVTGSTFVSASAQAGGNPILTARSDGASTSTEPSSRTEEQVTEQKETERGDANRI